MGEDTTGRQGGEGEGTGRVCELGRVEGTDLQGVDGRVHEEEEEEEEESGLYIGEGKGGAVWRGVKGWRLGQHQWEERENRGPEVRVRERQVSGRRIGGTGGG